METPMNVLRLSDAERKALLQQIAVKANSEPMSAKRQDTRYALPPEYSILGEFFLQQGASQRVLVSLRDISRGGLAMLYGNYVHKGTKCMFVVCDSQRKPVVTASGEVIRCNHVKGTVHDVGVKFDKPLPVDMLLKVTSSEPESAGQNSMQTYPALLALCDDLLKLIRIGAPIENIRSMLAEMEEAIRKATTEAKPEAKPEAAKKAA